MKWIAPIALSGFLLFGPASAETAPKGAATGSIAASSKFSSDYEDVVNLSTRFGPVQYREQSGSQLWVQGALIYENRLVDRLQQLGHFKLSNKDVVLFEGVNGGSGGSPGETFFLILMPGYAPKIVVAPLNPLSNRITKVWAKNEIVFANFQVNSYEEFKPPLKLIAGKVVVASTKPLSFLRGRHTLIETDCSRIYEIASASCKKMSIEAVAQCASKSDTRGMIGDSNSESGFFNWFAHQKGFETSSFNDVCQQWCSGKDVAYEQFSATVCNIR